MKLKSRKQHAKIASLSPLQIQKLREYEIEMGLILIAYQNEKSDSNVMRNSNDNLGKNKI
jgi:hypothetical protein